MFGRRQRREERLCWEGFRDALVIGRPNPSQSETGVCRADEPRYRQGFEDGKRAAKRIHRDALVSEVRRLSLKSGDKVVVKSTAELTMEMVEKIRDDLAGQFPDNEILIFAPGLDLSVVEPA